MRIPSKILTVKKRLNQFLFPSQFLPNPANNRQLEKLRDIHKGKRAFILGNGPSLTVEDMNLLKDEITFASNRIFLAYEQTDWRPTYYTLADEIVAQNNLNRIRSGELGGRILFNSSIFKYAKGIGGVTFCNPPAEAGEANWDPVLGIRAGNSVINLGLKLAFFMGIREVYVIGCDHSFQDKSIRTGEKIAGNEVIISQGEQNHFHPDYRKAGETWTVPQVDLIAQDFEVAQERYLKAGGSIYNASRKTALKAWPLVNLDDVLS
jgi:hypothetical protein